MKNHDEKTKDMIESVLPSTARKATRDDRRVIHKRQRARQRTVLAQPSRVVGADEFDPDFREGRRVSATQWMVLDRRSADKIGPLTRWAVAIVNADSDLRDAPLHVQVDHFARLLPADLVGRHAVQHIEWSLRYEASRSTPPDWRAESEARQQRHRDQVVEQVRHIVEAGGHGALNAALRRHYRSVTVADDGTVQPREPGRYLLGAHDIDAFIDAVAPFDWVRTLICEVAKAVR